MATNMEKSLNNVFNIADEVELLPVAKPSLPVVSDSHDIEDDFEYARKNLKDIITKGQDALDTVFDLAKTSESPRAFEVASQMVKTLTDANKDLLELRKKKKDLSGEQAQSAPQTVNNHLFVGSTAELQQLIKKNKEIQ